MSFDEANQYLEFNTDKLGIVGNHEIPVTLTNSAGSTDYALKVKISCGPDREPYFNEGDWESISYTERTFNSGLVIINIP